MKRKVQAQRKFAQGVYVPQSNERRGDLIKDLITEEKKGKDIIYSNMSPSHLLDVISFENIHKHDARVVVKRLQDNIVTEKNKVVEKKPSKVERRSPVKTKPSPPAVKKVEKRVERPLKIVNRNVMSLRSKVIANKTKTVALKRKRIGKVPLKLKPLVAPKALVARRPLLRKPVDKKVPSGVKRKMSPILSGFSTDDDTPLNMISQPKVPGGEKNDGVKRKKVKQAVVPAKRTFTLRSSASKTSENTPIQTQQSKPKIKTTVKQEHDASMNQTSDSDELLDKPKSRQCKSFYSRNQIEKWIVDSAEQSLESPEKETLSNTDVTTPTKRVEEEKCVGKNTEVCDKTAKVKVVETSKAKVVETSKAKVVETSKAKVVETSKAKVIETSKAKVIETSKAKAVETLKKVKVPDTGKAKLPEVTGKVKVKSEAKTTGKIERNVNKNEVKVTLTRNDSKIESKEVDKSVKQPHYNFKMPEPRLRRSTDRRSPLSRTTQNSPIKSVPPKRLSIDSKELPALTKTKSDEANLKATESLKEIEAIKKDESKNDVYAFDDSDSVKEPILTGFRQKPKTSEVSSDNNPLYLDILPENSSHTIQLVPVKVPNQEKPIMRAKLVPKTDVNNLKDMKSDQVIKLLEQDSILEQIFNNLGADKKSNMFSTPKKPEISNTKSIKESNISSNKKTTSTCTVTSKDSQSNRKSDDFNIKKYPEPNSGNTSVKNEKIASVNTINDQDLKKKIDYENDEVKNVYKMDELLEAPTFTPTEAEFENAMEYIQKITPQAAMFGLCKIVPPESFKPDCFIEDTAKFTATNQYPGKMFKRWGPATKELCAIKAHLATQKVLFTRPPLIDSIEVDLPKLYHIVQKMGGLKNVIEKKKWHLVAEKMNYSKNNFVERKLDQVYVKYLLPYDTLTDAERKKILDQVEKEWAKRYKNMLHRAKNPLQKQRRELGLSSSSGSDEEDEDSVSNALDEADDCVTSGRHMNLATFQKIGQNLMQMQFANIGRDPTPEEVEQKYWQLVSTGSEHVCCVSAALDTAATGYGFTTHRHQHYGRHPWNPKVLSVGGGSALCGLRGGVGLTAPTLHAGVALAASAWHQDPHALPWTEYLHRAPTAPTTATKIWYGISESESSKFQSAVDELCPAFRQNKAIWLASDITMIPPRLLTERGVRLSRVVQRPGEYIIVFPKAFSSSICTGFTISESVYFAPMSWLKTVYKEFQEVRESCEPTMFSLEQLLLATAQAHKTPRSVLPDVRAALAGVASRETKYRRDLQHMGLVATEAKHPPKKKHTAWNVREFQECDICRTTLYLSKVVGLTSKKSGHCLQHAVELLQRPGNKRQDLNDNTTLIYYFKEEYLYSLIAKLKRQIDSMDD